MVQLYFVIWFYSLDSALLLRGLLSVSFEQMTLEIWNLVIDCHDAPMLSTRPPRSDICESRMWSDVCTMHLCFPAEHLFFVVILTSRCMHDKCDSVAANTKPCVCVIQSCQLTHFEMSGDVYLADVRSPVFALLVRSECLTTHIFLCWFLAWVTSTWNPAMQLSSLGLLPCLTRQLKDARGHRASKTVKSNVQCDFPSKHVKWQLSFNQMIFHVFSWREDKLRNNSDSVQIKIWHYQAGKLCCQIIKHWLWDDMEVENGFHDFECVSCTKRFRKSRTHTLWSEDLWFVLMSLHNMISTGHKKSPSLLLNGYCLRKNELVN